MRNNRKANRQSATPVVKWKLWLLLTGLLMVLSVSIYFGARYAINTMFHAVFPMKVIIFSGNKHLTDNELKAIMGMKGDEGLLGLSCKDLSAKLLKSPWIRAVSFRKNLPDKLLINIEEAAPFAILEMKGHTFFVDDKGKLLEEIKNESVPFLPIITGDPFKDNTIFSEALSLVRVIKEKGFISTKNRIEIIMPPNSGPEDISLQVDGTLVKVGYGEYEEKLQRLLDLEGEIVRRGIPVDYIDLRFANRVIVKPINEVIR